MKDIKCNQRQIEEIKTFHQLHKGRAYSFRFPDQFDYLGRDELLGIGDGENTEFQLLKGYHYSGRTEYREIKQPIPSSVKLKISGWEAGPEFACHSDGIVKLNQPPAVDSRITADFEFDILARFDMDELQISPGEDGSLVLDELLVKEVI
jgi:uncharacterized protein (TIGR02217 family)